MKLVKANVLVDEAARWLGTPWRHQGRQPGIALDCIGLLICCLRNVGAVRSEAAVAELERADYARNPRGDELKRAIARYCLPAGRLTPGLLILFRMPQSMRHVAIFAGERRPGLGETVIHADSGHGGVVEQGYRGHLVTRTDSLWSLPGIDYREPRGEGQHDG